MTTYPRDHVPDLHVLLVKRCQYQLSTFYIGYCCQNMFNEQYYDIVVVSSWPHVYEDKIVFLFNSLKYACAIPDIQTLHQKEMQIIKLN